MRRSRLNSGSHALLEPKEVVLINHKVLEALQEVDKLITEELKLKQATSGFPSEKDNLRNARDKVQEAITCILKGV